MYYFYFIIVFIFGLAFGSFINALIYRQKTSKKITGRSKCPKCKHQLGVLDLIPIFSYVFLRGKCRYCGKAISIEYPLVELATGLIFALNFFIIFPSFSSLILTFDFSTMAKLILYLFYSTILIIIFIYDAKYGLILNKVITTGIVIASFVWLVITGLYFLGHSTFVYEFYPISTSTPYNPILIVLGAVLASSLFFLLVFFSKEKLMGAGDIKLGLFMGLILGFPQVIFALLFSFVSGSIIGILLILFEKKTFKSTLPFAPFLVFGTFIMLFWGQIILNWYLKLLG